MKTEIVGVERELLERINRCYMDGMSIYGECAELRALLAQPASEAVAYVTGQFAGRAVVEPVDRAAVLPTGMALYAGPPAPAVPDGYALVPVELTAENGAKYALIGEFKIEHSEVCGGCMGVDDDEPCEGCEFCDGTGEVSNPITIDWDTLKEIWKAGIKHFAAAPGRGDETADKGAV